MGGQGDQIKSVHIIGVKWIVKTRMSLYSPDALITTQQINPSDDEYSWSFQCKTRLSDKHEDYHLSRGIKCHAGRRDSSEYFTVGSTEIWYTGHALSSAVKDSLTSVDLWLSLVDQDQISSCSIPLEKAINNGNDQRDGTSRQCSPVALTMRGSPFIVFP